MVECEECDKKLRLFEGYRHPALGERFIVCGKCFDKVNADMKRWSTFSLSGSFDTKSSNEEIHEAWNNELFKEPELQRWFHDLWIKFEFYRLLDLSAKEGS